MKHDDHKTPSRLTVVRRTLLRFHVLTYPIRTVRFAARCVRASSGITQPASRASDHFAANNIRFDLPAIPAILNMRILRGTGAASTSLLHDRVDWFVQHRSSPGDAGPVPGPAASSRDITERKWIGRGNRTSADGFVNAAAPYARTGHRTARSLPPHSAFRTASRASSGTSIRSARGKRASADRGGRSDRMSTQQEPDRAPVESARLGKSDSAETRD